LWLYLKGLWLACLAIRRIHRKTPVDAIFVWCGENPLNVLVTKILAMSLGAVLIAEHSEFPFVSSRKTAVIRIVHWVSERITVKWLDGATVISTMLHDYFAAKMRPGARLLPVPILVDTAAFAPPAQPRAREKRTIVFCGNVRHDGEADGLLRAFSRIAGDFPEWSVQIIADLSEGTREAELKKLAADLHLADRVELTGLRPRSEIPAALAQGDVMALPRASGTFSTAGVPTKLGEYLASGKPVVVTSTGDISRYLRDGVDAFLTPPDDNEAFAQRLRYVLAHPDEAAEVGRRGRQTAVAQFDTFVQGARIVQFLRELRAERYPGGHAIQ
jgi:glycosyltransferase involved in cell wall biosynthesis